MTKENDHRPRVSEIVRHGLAKLWKYHNWVTIGTLILHGIDAASVPFRCDTSEQESLRGRDSVTICSGILERFHWLVRDLHDTNGTEDRDDDINLESWGLGYGKRGYGLYHMLISEGSPEDPRDPESSWALVEGLNE